ncbi:phosphohydrolase [secondary endosymbiont of Ctenarytaina eucalypti]|uniref:Putative HD superfamily hydrolase n=1 Tax=secondary endosymbiont of Ctenarytaina eucalypti TaxID=1199245 RepID=J3Z4L8_9ENTR|nr:phosphohydrolase [secondary endosymbiont of Ctenarytaina eucalypti]AFP85244.1 putative HD superfamily hydrolase [secondary endosymbiont of Ctenarytaina eucalypti]
MTLEKWEIMFQKYLERYFPQNDKAHDISHFSRVWKTARRIMQFTDADGMIILAASYFHDVVNLPKNHSQRHLASQQAALRTQEILAHHFPTFPAPLYSGVAHAIEAHSFSAGITPETLEAKIVQDADRLESLGAIGIARVFHVAGQLGRGLFHASDPLALYRQLDDVNYTFDHFQTKLLTLADSMQTDLGKKMARYNIEYLVTFMSKLCAELKGEHYQLDQETLERFNINHKVMESLEKKHGH